MTTRVFMHVDYYGMMNGITYSVDTLKHALESRHDCIVDIFAADDRRYNSHSQGVVRLPSRRFLMFPYLVCDYLNPQPVWEQVIKGKYDIIHTHHPSWTAMHLAEMARVHNVPHVSTYHTLYREYSYPYLKHHFSVFGLMAPPITDRIMQWWLQKYYGLCDQVVVPSMVALNSLRQYCPQGTAHTIPTGVSIPLLCQAYKPSRQLIREQWSVPASATVFLHVGRISPEKNIAAIVKAFAEALPHLSEAYLVVIGDGQSLHHLQRIVQWFGIERQVRFLGRLPHAELAPHYAAADWFVTASRTETQGMTTFEARAAGTPSIVTVEAGAAADIYEGQDGLIAEHQQLSSAFRYATQLSPARLKDMRQTCRDRALFYTPDEMARRMMAVYDDVLLCKQSSMDP